MKLNRILRSSIPITKYPAIKNENIIPCWQCKHFSMCNETCDLFKEKNIVTGEIKKESAMNCRLDETKCGKSATLYEQCSPQEYNSRQYSVLFYPFTIAATIIFVIVFCD